MTVTVADRLRCDNATHHSAIIIQLYKDGDNWKDSSLFGRDDLPGVGKVIDKCHDLIYAYQAASSSSGNDNGHSHQDDSF